MKNTKSQSGDKLATVAQAMRSGRGAEARRMLSAHLKAHPRDADAHRMMAQMAANGGDPKAALQHAGSAARLAPQSYLCRLDHAKALLLSGHPEDALAESEAALGLKPEDISAELEHARILFNTSKQGAAIPYLERIVAAHPHLAEAHAMLAVLYSRDARFEDVVHATEMARKGGIESPELDEQRGYALMKLGRAADARGALERALSRDPGRLRSLRLLSWALFRIGETDKARAATAEHARLMPLQKIGRDDAKIRLFVPELISLAGAYNSDYSRNIYARGNFIASLNRDEVQRIHFPVNFVAPAEAVRLAGAAGGVLYNNLANAEFIDLVGGVEKLTSLFAESGLPVINPVDKVAMTAREINYQRLKDDPSYIFPRTLRFEVSEDPQETVREILAEFEPPFLLRPIHSNQRGGLRLINDAAELRANPPEALFPIYAIEYHRTPLRTPVGGDEGVGQFRAAVVEGRIFPERLVWGAGDFTPALHNRAELRFNERGISDMERRYLEAPEEVLGRPLEVIFKDMISTIGLDIFGIDFGISEQGEIIVFEANAAMNLFAARLNVYAPYRAPFRRIFEDAILDLFARTAEKGVA